MPRRARNAVAVIAAAALTAAATLTASTVARADSPTAGSTYTLTAGHTGMCLDVSDASDDPGTVLQQWGCAEGAAWQRFRLIDAGSGAFEIVNADNGLCLDVAGGSTAIGAEVLQWSCKGSAWQHWTLVEGSEGAYQVVNVHSGLCLTVRNGSTSSGAQTVQGQCTTADDKKWHFTTAGGGGSGNDGEYTVAADGTGTYTTVQAAIDAVPAGNTQPVTITIKPGTYRETVIVPSNKPYVSLIGGGRAADTVIVNNVSAGQAGSLRGSATAVVLGHDFFADNLTIENDYDEAANGQSQALALYLNADRAVLDDLRLLGDQDTFLVNNDARAYVSDTYIEGTVDFIFGGGIAVFHRCLIYEKRSTGGPITAASTPAENPYGFLFYRSEIRGATDGTTQLGRPWRQGAQVVYRESELSATIETAQPWINMGDATWQNARYFEYANTGPGATENNNRPQLTPAQAANYTPERYLAGDDGWDPIDRSGADMPAILSASAGPQPSIG
ncbi:pectinesterase family protein [Myceligenerans pegani]|uniref:Pectinesterase n=1 Tax=Myceligenerans pegani TaxID=2776917 RepID=A0ABR9MSV9_9MICO|nr:pectinesterase family protein [Myceligenerans sp. TRM 65318]MBE1874468.1 RICIN domain-containing protein [Myceligenerans sp. TRM 65318]MBE3016739.1 RICIN domain-containing protein [Myceligenerans sp. TRM 65318]